MRVADSPYVPVYPPSGQGTLVRVGGRAAGLAVACLSALAMAACTGMPSTDLSAAGRTCTEAVDETIAGMGDQYRGGDFVEIGEGGE